MLVEGLQIPTLLSKLVEAGVWPSRPEALQEQNVRSLIPKDRNRQLRRICLYPPPFKTLAYAIAGNDSDDFYQRYGAMHELVPEAAIAIADFGVGADSPILLDFRRGPSNPFVISLEWGKRGNPNRWVIMADSFEEFVDMLGLLSVNA